MNPQIETLVEDLQNLINKEVTLLEEFVLLLQQEQTILFQFSPDKLLEINRQKEVFCLKGKVLEQSRLSLMEQICQALPMAESMVSLEILLEILRDQENIDLTVLEMRLKENILQVKELNDMNRRFVEHSLRTIDGTLSLFKNAISPHAKVYNSYGKICHSTRGIKRLDGRI